MIKIATNTTNGSQPNSATTLKDDTGNLRDFMFIRRSRAARNMAIAFLWGAIFGAVIVRAIWFRFSH